MARLAGALVLAPLLTLACDAPPSAPPPPPPAEPPDRDFAQAERGVAERASTDGDALYRVSLRPQSGGVPLHELHAWVVRVEDAKSGAPVALTRLAFSGGMPQHQHGFVTEPRVTRALAPGEYLVEGVKFHMAGEWTLRVELVGPAGPELALFRVQVVP